MLVDEQPLNRKHTWTPEEIAAEGRLFIGTVYRHIREGLLPAHRVGRQRLRIHDADARAYLERDRS